MSLTAQVTMCNDATIFMIVAFIRIQENTIKRITCGHQIHHSSVLLEYWRKKDAEISTVDLG